MPWRAIVSKDLAELLGVLAHPHRLRIIQEIHSGEKDVNSLEASLGISHSRVSQHLSLLRSHRLVAERREGRHVHYRLVEPKLAEWLANGFEFLTVDSTHQHEVAEALEKARGIWTAG